MIVTNQSVSRHDAAMTDENTFVGRRISDAAT